MIKPSPITEARAAVGKALFLVSPTLALIACMALSAPMAALIGAPTPSPSNTVEQVPSPTPSSSATPETTETPTAAPSPAREPMLSVLPTFLSPSPPPTPTVPSKLDCKLIWQSPGNGVIYEPDEDFTVGWKVTNSGTAEWDADRVTFTYLGGAKLYDYPTVHLKSRVAPGQTVVLSVQMRAPGNSTKYTTYWSLRQGDAFFCRLALSIYVEESAD